MCACVVVVARALSVGWVVVGGGFALTEKSMKAEAGFLGMSGSRFALPAARPPARVHVRVRVSRGRKGVK